MHPNTINTYLSSALSGLMTFYVSLLPWAASGASSWWGASRWTGTSWGDTRSGYGEASSRLSIGMRPSVGPASTILSFKSEPCCAVQTGVALGRCRAAGRNPQSICATGSRMLSWWRTGGGRAIVLSMAPTHQHDDRAGVG